MAVNPIPFQSVNNVTLFVPCIADQIYPEVAVSVVSVLKHLGLEVNYNPKITCCGQPAYTLGCSAYADEIIECTLLELSQSEGPIVAPSGSCVAMLRNIYPELLKEEKLQSIYKDVATRLFEFSEFLVRSGLLKKISGKYARRVGLHNSCHSLRELGLATETKTVLSVISELTVVTPKEENVCCGFGGVFSAAFPNVAQSMAKSRLEAFIEAGAEKLIVNDPGCIMQLRLEAVKQGLNLEILHPAEFLCEVLNLSRKL